MMYPNRHKAGYLAIASMLAASARVIEATRGAQVRTYEVRGGVCRQRPPQTRAGRRRAKR